MQLFSKSAEYALRALACVAEHGFETPFNAADLCEAADIPEAFARKGFQQLVRAGILQGTRGPGGGYKLRLSPETVTLYDVLEAMDGPDLFRVCPLGVETHCGDTLAECETCAHREAPHPRCGLASVCPIHETWTSIRKIILQKFAGCTLLDVQQKALKNRQDNAQRKIS